MTQEQKDSIKAIVEATLAVAKRRRLYSDASNSLHPCWCEMTEVCINQPQCDLVKTALKNLKLND